MSSQVATNMKMSNLFHPMHSGESLTDLNTALPKAEIFEQFVGSSYKMKEESKPFNEENYLLKTVQTKREPMSYCTPSTMASAQRIDDTPTSNSLSPQKPFEMFA